MDRDECRQAYIIKLVQQWLENHNNHAIYTYYMFFATELWPHLGAALPNPSYWSSSQLCGIPEEEKRGLWGGMCSKWARIVLFLKVAQQ